MTLSSLQIDLIKGDLRQNGVELTELQDDLVDHICCIMESDNSLISFEDAYAKVKSEYFQEGFKNIQESTTELLAQKDEKRKRIINTLGVISSIMLLLGSILKTLSMVGANEFILLSSLGLLIGYLPLLLSLTIKQTDILTGKIRNISGFIGAEFVFLGILFQILHIAWGREILFFGLVIIVLIFLPLLFKFSGTDVLSKLRPATISVLILAIASTFFAFSNKKPSQLFRGQLVSVGTSLTDLVKNQDDKLINVSISKSQAKVGEDIRQINAYLDELKEYIINRVSKGSNSVELDMDNVLLNNPIVNDIMITNSNNHEWNGITLYNRLYAIEQNLLEGPLR